MIRSIVLACILFAVLDKAFSHTHPYQDEIYKVIQVGHPTLRLEAEEIDTANIKTEAFQKMIKKMFKTMRKTGGVGLAAPQINISKQIFVFGDWASGVKSRVMINPIIEFIGNREKPSTEGCLSTEGRGYKKVLRFRKLRASYYDEDGEYQEREFGRFAAIIIQHEFDHLLGKLIIDYSE